MTEKHKRFVLAGIGVVAVIYCYFALLISPELAETARLRHDLELSRQRVMSASAELKQLEAREHAALGDADRDGAARDLLGTIPSPFMVTTPPVLDDVTEQHELPSTKVKLFMMQPFKGLPEHAIAAWNITVSEANALRVGEVIADLENRFPLGRLSELQVETDSGSGTLNALLQFQTLVRP